MPFSFHDFVEVLTLQSYNTRLVVAATWCLGIGSGLVGSLLLLRKRSLMGDVLSHATLPGIAIAFAIVASLGGAGKSLPALLVGATLSGLAGVAVMLAIRRTTRLRDDVAMGFVLSVFFGTGVAILRMVQNLPGASGLTDYIYGRTASIVLSDLLLIALVTTAVIVTVVLLLKEFTLLCFDEAFAASEGWPVLLLDTLVLALVTAVTVIGIQAVGLILVIAFLIIPAASARFWTENMKLMLVISAAIGGISGHFGALLSDLFADLPSGPVIVLTASSIFLISMFFGGKRGVLPRYMDHLKLKRRVGRQHLLRSVYEILEASDQPVSNRPVTLQSLLQHRSWTMGQLKRKLSLARREDHLEPTSDPSAVLLSESGFGEAARITRNHRLWELYLIHHAEIAPSHVDRDADMVEHILGPEMVRELEAELAPDLQIPASPHLI
ncbi:ABC-type Mn2+/Zn2+ transporter permease [Haloferula helveola]|uniref:ABC-type Mn2+/Zn2+ transporter permease n=1 Tax=Haloferula helveola TaxID=490095 RepID=A0ABN6H945_9BACT|nr:ABC-type Mn2+/Zn2+ transporter permease [Haloferula helveola]